MRPRKVRMAEKGRQREGKGTKGALRRGGGFLPVLPIAEAWTSRVAELPSSRMVTGTPKKANLGLKLG